MLKSQRIIRLLDLTAAVLLLPVAVPVVVILGVLIRITSPGPALFRQVRVGRFETPFICLKLRTMSIGTRNAGTHEISADSVTPLGRRIRSLKLDELPQLWNVLKGEMSLVGPRPSLPVQLELIRARRLRNVFAVRPGVTGPSQVNDIDMSTPELLAETDAQYASCPTVPKYFTYIVLTMAGRGQGDRVGRETL